jgi:hypothetical protein
MTDRVRTLVAEVAPTKTNLGLLVVDEVGNPLVAQSIGPTKAMGAQVTMYDASPLSGAQPSPRVRLPWVESIPATPTPYDVLLTDSVSCQ